MNHKLGDILTHGKLLLLLALVLSSTFWLVPELSYGVSSCMRSVPPLSRRWPELGGGRGDPTCAWRCSPKGSSFPHLLKAISPELEVCGEPSIKLDLKVTLFPYPRGYSREVWHFPLVGKVLKVSWSSPSREWSWEPRVSIHPSLLEMTPLRIPSPAPDLPEYSCQGSEESSLSGDESFPPRELGEGDALCMSGRGVIPYASEEGATSRGLVGVPPSYPLAARPEGRSPRKLRIKLKSRSLGESSQNHPETTALCVVDVVNTLGPLPGGEGIVSKEPPNDESLLTSFMRLAGCTSLLRFFFQKNLKFYAPKPFERPNVMRSGGSIGFAVYRHSVQFGLRFPLCPFYQSLCSFLRISPSQLTPNSWGTICTFLLRCRELEVEPNPNLFFLYHGIQKCMVDSVLFLSVRARLNKKLIEIATSKVHKWKDRWCWAYGPAFSYQNTPWRTSLPELPQKKVLKKALSEAEKRFVQVFDQRLKEGRLWDVNMKHSLSSLQWVGIVSGSPDLSCPELELSSLSFLSIGGGGSDRFHGPDDDDVRSYVGSEEAGLRTPPLQDLTRVLSLDETGMTKGRRLQLPSGAFANRGRGRRGAGGRGRPDSPDRARVMILKILIGGVLAMLKTAFPSLFLLN
ncbi:hypothetical protein Dimus_027192 [Dionaea muscipula]